MGLTLADIQAKVRLLTKEPYPSTPTFATDANVTYFANRAQLDLASQTKAKVVSNIPNNVNDPSEQTTAGVRLYAVPSKILEIYKVWVQGYECTYRKIEDLQEIGPRWWRMQSLPTSYYFEDDPTTGTQMIGFWPTPGSVWPIAYMGVKRPANMAASGDSPDFDDRLHDAVVYKTCQRVMEMRREFDKSQYWEAQATREIEKYKLSGQQTNEPSYLLGSAGTSD